MYAANHPEAIKLFKNIAKYSDKQTAERIAFGVDLPASPSKKERQKWVEFITAGLEETFDAPVIKLIRTGCYCDEEGKLEENKKWLQKLYRSSKDIDEFVNKVNEHSAGWYIKEGKLYTKYLDCACPMIENMVQFRTKTWCYCTAGFAKEIFDNVFGYEVDIDILETIKTGSEFCLVRVSKKDGGAVT